MYPIGGFLKWWYPQIIHFRIFQQKTSILVPVPCMIFMEIPNWQVVLRRLMPQVSIDSPGRPITKGRCRVSRCRSSSFSWVTDGDGVISFNWINLQRIDWMIGIRCNPCKTQIGCYVILLVASAERLRHVTRYSIQPRSNHQPS